MKLSNQYNQGCVPLTLGFVKYRPNPTGKPPNTQTNMEIAIMMPVSFKLLIRDGQYSINAVGKFISQTPFYFFKIS